MIGFSLKTAALLAGPFLLGVVATPAPAEAGKFGRAFTGAAAGSAARAITRSNRAQAQEREDGGRTVQVDHEAHAAAARAKLADEARIMGSAASTGAPVAGAGSDAGSGAGSGSGSGANARSNAAPGVAVCIAGCYDETPRVLKPARTEAATVAKTR